MFRKMYQIRNYSFDFKTLFSSNLHSNLITILSLTINTLSLKILRKFLKHIETTEITREWLHRFQNRFQFQLAYKLYTNFYINYIQIHLNNCNNSWPTVSFPNCLQIQLKSELFTNYSTDKKLPVIEIDKNMCKMYQNIVNSKTTSIWKLI